MRATSKERRKADEGKRNMQTWVQRRRPQRRRAGRDSHGRHRLLRASRAATRSIAKAPPPAPVSRAPRSPARSPTTRRSRPASVWARSPRPARACSIRSASSIPIRRTDRLRRRAARGRRGRAVAGHAFGADRGRRERPRDGEPHDQQRHARLQGDRVLRRSRRHARTAPPTARSTWRRSAATATSGSGRRQNPRRRAGARCNDGASSS